MTVDSLWKAFTENFPNMAPNVEKYYTVRGNPSALRVKLKNGRQYLFELDKKGKFSSWKRIKA